MQTSPFHYYRLRLDPKPALCVGRLIGEIVKIIGGAQLMNKPILATLTIVAVASICASSLAQAQSTVPEKAKVQDEVVVTVRKTEERLQDVPLAVTALTEETLERATVQAMDDIANLTPGLVFQDFNVGALSTPVIRGLAQSNIQGGENNVGLFLDGVYLPSRNNMDLELLDLARIEVVKGPQGALYGRSTFAGSINYVTRTPSDQLDVQVSGSAGTDDYYDGQLYVSGPITDTLSGTAAYAQRSFDGTIDNSASSDNLGGYDNSSVMGKLFWAPNDKLSASLLGFYSSKEIDSAGIYNDPMNCGNNGFGGFTYTCGTLQFKNPVSVNPLASGGDAESTVVALDVAYDFGALTLTSVTGYTTSHWSAITDYDANADGVPYTTANPAGTTNLNALFFNWTSSDTLSQEFRVNGGDGKFTWLAGAYWASERGQTTSAVTLDSTPLLPGQTISFFLSPYLTPEPLYPNATAGESSDNLDMYAFFARGQWEIGDRSRVSLEARYTNEDKDTNGKKTFGSPFASGKQSNDWSYITPRITYDYRLTEEIMLYASAAKGTKTGGFNAAYPASQPEEAYYDEETNITYEIGSKGTLVDGRLRYDVAVFYIDWSDMQISGASEDPAFLTAIVRNTGNATSEGIELQLDGIVTDWLTVGGGYAYANPEFDSGTVDLSLVSVCGDGTLCTTDVGGKQIGRTIKNQLNLYTDLHSALNSEWDWYARVDYIYRDESPTRSANLQYIDDWSLVNARIGVTNKHWEVAVWAKNLFDDGNVTSQIRQPQLNNFALRPTTVIEGNLRQVALTVTYRL